MTTSRLVMNYRIKGYFFPMTMIQWQWYKNTQLPIIFFSDFSLLSNPLVAKEYTFWKKLGCTLNLALEVSKTVGSYKKNCWAQYLNTPLIFFDFLLWKLWLMSFHRHVLISLVFHLTSFLFWQRFMYLVFNINTVEMSKAKTASLWVCRLLSRAQFQIF